MKEHRHRQCFQKGFVYIQIELNVMLFHTRNIMICAIRSLEKKEKNSPPWSNRKNIENEYIRNKHTNASPHTQMLTNIHSEAIMYTEDEYTETLIPHSHSTHIHNVKWKEKHWIGCGLFKKYHGKNYSFSLGNGYRKWFSVLISNSPLIATDSHWYLRSCVQSTKLIITITR